MDFFEDNTLSIKEKDSVRFINIEKKSVIGFCQLERKFCRLWKLDEDSWGDFEIKSDFLHIIDGYYWNL